MQRVLLNQTTSHTVRHVQSGAAPQWRAQGAPVIRRGKQEICRYQQNGIESGSYDLNVHGRHVTVDNELENHVRSKLETVLTKFGSADYVEGEGGLKEVDVRLMNTQAEIKVRPRQVNKMMGDTYLRMGELKVLAFGDNVHDSFDKACVELEKKLVKYNKGAPKKVDYRSMGRN